MTRPRGAVVAGCGDPEGDILAFTDVGDGLFPFADLRDLGEFCFADPGGPGSVPVASEERLEEKRFLWTRVRDA